jgi:hypothetical protein
MVSGRVVVSDMLHYCIRISRGQEWIVGGLQNHGQARTFLNSGFLGATNRSTSGDLGGQSTAIGETAFTQRPRSAFIRPEVGRVWANTVCSA